MIQKVTIYSAILAVVFAAIGCFGDSIAPLYSTCMGLCIASLLVFIACLLKQEYGHEEAERAIRKKKESLKKAA